MRLKKGRNVGQQGKMCNHRGAVKGGAKMRDYEPRREKGAAQKKALRKNKEYDKKQQQKKRSRPRKRLKMLTSSIFTLV